MSGWRAALCVLVVPVCAAAVPLGGKQAVALLDRVAAAAYRQSYSGIYQHQYARSLMTYRLAHASGLGNPLEKRESLDDPPWEVVRDNQSLTVYAPDRQALKAARTGAFQTFPSLFGDNRAEIARHYAVERIGKDRAAGRDCVWWQLTPRDAQRYPRRFCADIRTSLILKSAILTADRQIIDRLSFSELKLGKLGDLGQLQPQYRDGAVWRMPVAAGDRGDGGRGIQIPGLPEGFSLQRDVSRRLLSGQQAVRHLVYSDGVASLSVFIERVPDAVQPTAMQNGAITLRSRKMGDILVTVVGDLPDNAVQSVSHTIILLRP
ncbi:MucB/RseB C-terminal domain-containing protein [Microvirgula aerodenitrificans]|uniref:MucB/RseB C-terminal domain-containing protein n=1 Tax=Microvirgula aerodenitrificans TaxID=57480 RepID=UPI00048AD2BD|nr:MucB/RseB C-terminal domain-containing protein [Microvirgula aerodenitrificans]